MPEIISKKIFEIGETWETNGNGQGEGRIGDLVVVIGDKEKLRSYSSYTYVESLVIATYNLTLGRLWWYNEDDLEPYCKNTDRGKLIIKDLERGKILAKYGINSHAFEEYMKKYF